MIHVKSHKRKGRIVKSHTRRSDANKKARAKISKHLAQGKLEINERYNPGAILVNRKTHSTPYAGKDKVNLLRRYLKGSQPSFKGNKRK